MDAIATALADHPGFRNLVVLAETDGVPIAAVLDEHREFYRAARLARHLVTVARQDAPAAHPDDVDPDTA